MRLACLITLVMAIQSWMPGLSKGEIIKFTHRPLHIPERGVVTEWMAQTESNTFIFIPPPDWQLQCQALENSILLISPDFRSRITFKLEQALATTNLSELRTNLINRFQKGEIIHQFTSYTSGLTGVTFDIQEKRPAGSLFHRITLVPYRQTLLELRLTYPQSQTNSTFSFDSVVASLRAEPLKATK